MIETVNKHFSPGATDFTMQIFSKDTTDNILAFLSEYGPYIFYEILSVFFWICTFFTIAIARYYKPTFIDTHGDVIENPSYELRSEHKFKMRLYIFLNTAGAVLSQAMVARQFFKKDFFSVPFATILFIFAILPPILIVGFRRKMRMYSYSHLSFVFIVPFLWIPITAAIVCHLFNGTIYGNIAHNIEVCITILLAIRIEEDEAPLMGWSRKFDAVRIARIFCIAAAISFVPFLIKSHI